MASECWTCRTQELLQCIGERRHGPVPPKLVTRVGNPPLVVFRCCRVRQRLRRLERFKTSQHWELSSCLRTDAASKRAELERHWRSKFLY